MRVVMLTIGTRGDVQPFVALARGLSETGHPPLIVAPEVFGEFVASHGIAFAPLPGDPAEFIRNMVDRTGTRFGLQTIREALRWALPIAREVSAQTEAVSRGADVVLASFLATIAGCQAARQLDVPFISAQLFPAFTPTSAFPMAALPQGRPWFNRLSYHLARAAYWNGSRVGHRILRRRYPDIARRLYNPFEPGLRTIYGFSRHVLPPPPDWDALTQVTGYWFLDQTSGWTPAQDLLDFLAAGEAPVCIGFGSMITSEAQRLSEVVIDAFRHSQRRAILLGGWGRFGASRLPEHIFATDAVPHDWLFDRVCALVHHGGAGTTGAGLRAGIPALIVPFTGDQPFWGARVAALGAGPRPIPHRKLTAEALSAAVETMLTDQAMRERAAALGRAIRAEDGVREAVRAIERFVGG